MVRSSALRLAGKRHLARAETRRRNMILASQARIRSEANFPGLLRSVDLWAENAMLCPLPKAVNNYLVPDWSEVMSFGGGVRVLEIPFAHVDFLYGKYNPHCIGTAIHRGGNESGILS